MSFRTRSPSVPPSSGNRDARPTRQPRGPAPGHDTQAAELRFCRPGQVQWIIWGSLLVFPLCALLVACVRSGFWYLALYPLVISVFAFLFYRHDKQRALRGEWRVSEFLLQLVSVLGGWPGAFLGQWCYRHKTSKFSYQLFFWLVVLAHEFIALDFLLHWRLTQALFHHSWARLGELLG